MVRRYDDCTFDAELAVGFKFFVERYPSRAKLEDPHQQSAPFKTFKEWWVNSGAVIEKSGMSCLETDIGFMARTPS